MSTDESPDFRLRNLDRIREMRCAPTYIFGGSGSTLWIVGRKRNGAETNIQMTEMAYTRAILADVVRRLSSANPNIRLDDSTQALLQPSNASPSK